MPKGLAGGKTLLLLGIALAFGGAGVISRHLSGPPEPQIATPPAIRAAEFWETRLGDLAERRQPLAQWLGKVVVINFWAPWCPPCRQEIPGFIALQKQYGGQGLQFIGIAVDEADKVRAYANHAGINYPILLGGDQAARLGQATGNLFGGLPYTVVFDRQGNAIAALTGEVSRARLEALVQPLL